jgi:hypothetical protein
VPERIQSLAPAYRLSLSTLSTRLNPQRHGSADLGSIGWELGEIAMVNWKADLDSLMEETMAFATSVGVEPPMPHAIVEPNRMPLVNWRASERDEVRQRVANFKAHQQRFMREREDHAAAELKRMRASRS